MWKDIEMPWQEALKMAWEAYKKGTIPIGCVIVNKDGKIISTGRNRIYDKMSNNPLAGCNMAHAEMTAMLGLSELDHPDMRTYTLYTSMEPCPMCFGTMVMMNIRKIRYGARDSFGGATSLNDKHDYIKSKNIDIKQGIEELEVFQLVLQSAYECGRQHPRREELLNTWASINKVAIEYAKELNDRDYFKKAVKEDKTIDQIYDEVIEGYYRICDITPNIV